MAYITLPGMNSFDCGHQFDRIYLCYVSASADRKSFTQEIGVLVLAEEEYLGTGRGILDECGRLQPIESRQAYVEENNIRLVRLSFSDCIKTV